MKKKGSLNDIIFISVVLFIILTGWLFAYKIMDGFNTEIQANVDIPADAKAASTTLTNHFPGALDNSILFLAVGLGIAALIMAAMVRIHPIFIPVYLILLGFVIFLSSVFSEIYGNIAESAVMVGISHNMQIAYNIMHYLPLIIGVFGSLLAIVMYKSWKDAN